MERKVLGKVREVVEEVERVRKEVGKRGEGNGKDIREGGEERDRERRIMEDKMNESEDQLRKLILASLQEQATSFQQ